MDSGCGFRVLAGFSAGDQAADSIARAIIAGGVPIMMLGSPVPLLCFLIILKIGMDIWLHSKSHKADPLKKREKHQDQKVERGAKKNSEIRSEDPKS